MINTLLNLKGFIDQPSLTNAKITDKGLEFLKENQRFGVEEPESKGELPQWVRYTGTIYKSKKTKSKTNTNHVYNYVEWQVILNQTLQLIKNKHPETHYIEILDKSNKEYIENH